MEYWAAEQDVRELVASVIADHHHRLDGCAIGLVMAERATKSGGRVVMATTAVCPPKVLPLFAERVSFLVTVADDTWQALTTDQQRALIDHELCHCAFKGDGQPRVLGHDYEEFACIVARHGMWREDYGEQQMQLAFDGIRVPARIVSPTTPPPPPVPAGAHVEVGHDVH